MTPEDARKAQAVGRDRRDQSISKRVERAWRALRGDTPAVQRRSYDGGETNRLLLDWIASSLRPDDEIRGSLHKMRGRGRELRRNKALVRQFLNLTTANVLGSDGPQLCPLVRRRDGELDKATNSALKDGFAEWAESKVTVDRRHNFFEMQELALRTVAAEGEIFIRQFVGFPNEWGYALQLIDADMIDSDLNRPRSAGANQIRMGVEVDFFGAPVAYWVFEEPLYSGSIGGPRYRVPAEEMIHLYRPERANQTRGVTWLSSVMVTLQMLHGYMMAELVGSRIAAGKMGFFVSQPEALAGELGSDMKNPDVAEVNPGTFETLPPGWKFEGFDPQHPVAAFGDFVKANLREIATGLGVSYNALANDLEGVNYSSLRSGLLIERELWRGLQKWIIANSYKPVYRGWLSAMNLTGMLRVPGGDYRAYGAHKWIPRGWAWVDPLKDAEASVLAISQGLASRTQILAEQGLEFEDVVEQLKEEKRILEEAGIEILPPNAQTFKADATQANADENSAPPPKNNGNGKRFSHADS